MRAVFADNICEIAAGIVDPVSVEIHFVIKKFTVQCTEGTKGIGCKQNAVCHVKGNHSLRPVYHRGIDKGDRMLSE